jgi:hypothetical protein
LINNVEGSSITQQWLWFATLVVVVSSSFVDLEQQSCSGRGGKDIFCYSTTKHQHQG